MTINDFKTKFPEIINLPHEELNALCEYYKSVEMLSDQGLNLEFNNKDRHHAAIVMSSIFKQAKESIKIFAEDFAGNICDNFIYINELKNAIENNSVTVDVVFKENPNSNSKALKLLKTLKSTHKDSVSVRIVNSDFKKIILENGICNFTIGDKQMFRYETDAINHKAFCNFDDVKTCKTLLDNFAVLKIKSKDLEF